MKILGETTLFLFIYFYFSLLGRERQLSMFIRCEKEASWETEDTGENIGEKVSQKREEMREISEMEERT